MFAAGGIETPEIADALETDHAGRMSVGAISRAFLEAGRGALVEWTRPLEI